MLCGHIENIQEQVEHLSHLRNLQRKSIEQKYPAKITEFILLPFISKNISSFPSKYLQSQELNFDKIFLLTAVSRIFLGKWILAKTTFFHVNIIKKFLPNCRAFFFFFFY